MGYPHRIKPEGETWYHIYNSTASKSGEYPLQDDLVRQKLIQTIQFYVRAYRLSMASFIIMGNHWHGVFRSDAKRSLTREELMRHALWMYPKSRKMIEAWPDEKWAHFEERIFDVSEFMRSVSSHFARWYNRMHSRKGSFWADRFKSTVLVSPESVRDCVLYIELNAVRAGLCVRPEEYRWSSLFLREAKQDKDLLPLSVILGERVNNIYEAYKEMLYHRGAIPTKPNHKTISQETMKKEIARGFKRQGVFRKRLRYFTDGLILGGELMIREKLTQMREQGNRKRRKNPVAHPEGQVYSLREQRSHFVAL